MYTRTYTLTPGTHTVGESSTMSVLGVRVDSNSHTYTHTHTLTPGTLMVGHSFDGGKKFTHVHTMHAHMFTPDTLIVGESPIIECTWRESGQQYYSSNSHTHTHTHTLSFSLQLQSLEIAWIEVRLVL